MNRLWFAGIFLVIAICLCTFEQYTVQTTYKTLDAMLESISEAANKKDYKYVREKCDEIEEIWDDKYTPLSSVSEHSSLNDFGLSIHALRGMAEDKSEHLEPTINEAQSQLEYIYKGSKISLGNIF